MKYKKRIYILMILIELNDPWTYFMIKSFE